MYWKSRIAEAIRVHETWIHIHLLSFTNVRLTLIPQEILQPFHIVARGSSVFEDLLTDRGQFLVQPEKVHAP